jgi:hypothetical protein
MVAADDDDERWKWKRMVWRKWAQVMVIVELSDCARDPRARIDTWPPMVVEMMMPRYCSMMTMIIIKAQPEQERSHHEMRRTYMIHQVLQHVPVQ